MFDFSDRLFNVNSSVSRISLFMHENVMQHSNNSADPRQSHIRIFFFPAVIMLVTYNNVSQIQYFVHIHILLFLVTAKRVETFMEWRETVFHKELCIDVYRLTLFFFHCNSKIWTETSNKKNILAYYGVLSCVAKDLSQYVWENGESYLHLVGQRNL